MDSRNLAQTGSIIVRSRGLTRFYDGINNSLSTYSGCKFNKSRVRCFNRPPCSYSSMIPKTDNHTDTHSVHLIIMGMTMVSLCTASIDVTCRTFASMSNTITTTTTNHSNSLRQHSQIIPHTGNWHRVGGYEFCKYSAYICAQNWK